MNNYLKNVIISNDYPVVISKFITGAKEIKVDALAHKGLNFGQYLNMLKMLEFMVW